MSKSKGNIKSILHSIKNKLPLVAFSLFLSVLSVIFSLYIPVLAGTAIDNITDKGVNFEAIYPVLIKIVVFAALSGLLQWIISLINNNVAYGTVKNLRDRAFAHINSLPVSYIDSHPYGDIVSRLTADLDQFSDGLLLGFSQLFSGLVTIIITLGFMFILNPVIALVVVLLSPISLLIARFISLSSYKLFKTQSQIRGEQTTLINQYVANLKTVKAIGFEKETIEDFDEINQKLKSCSVKAIFFSSLTNPTTRFINSIIYAAVSLSGAFAILSKALTVGGFVSFLAYSNQYTKPFNEISGVIAELQNALACFSRIREFLELEPENDEITDQLSSDFKGNIEIQNVSFSYDKARKLLENVNVSAKQGMKIAIVGPTGCGKTTLINLLMRFYDTNSGVITLDGVDIKAVSRKALRNQFGMVLQDTWIKRGTVAENIAYAKPDATPEEIINAAKKAHAHSFIKHLENGYDTQISDDDGVLSQGEKQLISIARVMLSNPKMLILDEATSSIDTRTELKIQDAFKQLMAGKTSFVVAHRLTTVLDADLILVMREGDIVEQGTHSQLMKQNGFYKTIFNEM